MGLGLALAIVAGGFVAIQNIFNSRVNEKAGQLATTTLVLALGFVASFAVGLVTQGGSMFRLEGIETWHWFSGLLGIGVVTCVVQGVKALGPTFAIAIIMTSQLGFALLWDSLGLFGVERIPFTWQQLVGVLIIVAGIVVFKFGGTEEKVVQKKAA
ncbi:DMT family transporter [Paenalkalicoccus suaedae]|uniref:DMT family transporter n=1 Tax=Paenalkalicoccus suaedae TaxID=2592382 RepID=A0A859FCL1_9BACI|nr:DMT family transporter [Paenalkalicoccus suaedae]QKS70521.1 DMT family transporter [Paenalkalicoccus suaedae]